jgi:membrane protein YqaA with SNARE-associated domain
MLRRLYHWVLALSEKRHAPWALAGVSFTESSFFPIPPDVMLVPMCLARPDRALRYAAICTIASVLGGLLGYAIGYLLYDTLGQFLIRLYGYGEEVEEFRTAYAEWGHWIILIKGVTPIPYKIVTITSGFAAYNLFWFLVLSIVTRGARYFAVALILYYWGAPARDFIEKRLELVAFLGFVLLVGGFIVVTWLL